MRDNSKMEKSMENAPSNRLQVKSTSGNGKWDLKMEKVYTNGQVGRYTRGNTRMIREMAMGK